MNISAIILSFNSEATIGATLESALKVSDDVHVVDSYSTDNTMEILKKYGVNVVQHPFDNYAAQRNWAIETLPIKHEWELHLDADERLTPELINEISELMSQPSCDVDGCFIARLVYFLGQPIRHGGMYPVWHMRFFRRGKGRCEERKYDQHFFVDGKTTHFKNPLIDDNCMSLEEWTARHNRWAAAEAEELLNPSTQNIILGKINGNLVEKKRALKNIYNKIPLFVRPFLLFVYRYLFRLGFLDGKTGFVFFVLQTFWFRFLVDAKILEKRYQKRCNTKE
jgi:glycosyltransferase involved in cell wall biosynthesis